MRNKFRFALLSMAVVGLFGCSDKLTDDIAQGQDETTDGFVAFKISSNDNATRAGGTDGGYNEGDANEYAITEEQGANVAFFFRGDKSYVDKSYLKLMSTNPAEDDHDGEYNDTNGNAKEKVYSARIKTSIQKDPYYCVLILNAAPADIEALDTSDYDAFMESKQTSGTLGLYGDYFTMSNTVYVKDNNNIIGAEEITADNICKTWEEALNHKVQVHVERVVAKFGMTFNKKGENNTIFTNGTTIVYGETEAKKDEQLTVRNGSTTTTSKWGIRIKGWALNGTETETYWVKNLNDGTNVTMGNIPNITLSTTSFGNWVSKYEQEDVLFKHGWNDPSRVRSYWAVDPHYNAATDVYPLQYRDANNEESGFVVGNNGTVTGLKTTLALNYISYDKIETGNTSKYLYAPENTFGDYTTSFSSWFMKNGDNETTYQFLGDGYRWTGTHILVAAELLLDDEVSGSNVGDKYCYSGVYWDEEQAKGEEGTGETDALINYMSRSLVDFMSVTLYTAKNTAFDPEKEGKDYFELVDATIKGGDGRQMLSLISGKKLYSDAECTKEADLQAAIWEAGTVQHFNKGKMYYAIPIEHLVNYEKDTEDSKNNKFNIGSFGVVRNHWYTVNISAIKKPGTPVDDPDEPIIPNDDPKEPSYVAFEIVVIPWHMVNQDVEF